MLYLPSQNNVKYLLLSFKLGTISLLRKKPLRHIYLLRFIFKFIYTHLILHLKFINDNIYNIYFNLNFQELFLKLERKI